MEGASTAELGELPPKESAVLCEALFHFPTLFRPNRTTHSAPRRLALQAFGGLEERLAEARELILRKDQRVAVELRRSLGDKGPAPPVRADELVAFEPVQRLQHGHAANLELGFQFRAGGQARAGVQGAGDDAGPEHRGDGRVFTRRGLVPSGRS